ncbi:hypothetical protein B4144_1494 [Bacillus atrophaeus]|nr:hypothetical protein B4144_1494 [Bacillus atrophaeus]
MHDIQKKVSNYAGKQFFPLFSFFKFRRENAILSNFMV